MFKNTFLKIWLQVLTQIYSDLVILAAILFLCKLGGQMIQDTLGKCWTRIRYIKLVFKRLDFWI